MNKEIKVCAKRKLLKNNRQHYEKSLCPRDLSVVSSLQRHLLRVGGYGRTWWLYEEREEGQPECIF